MEDGVFPPNYPPSLRAAYDGVGVNLPAAGLVLHLDASQIVGLSDGDPVASWADLSDSGYDATQAAPEDRPVFKTDVKNGLPVVRFVDGQFLTLDTAGPILRNCSGMSFGVVCLLGTVVPSPQAVFFASIGGDPAIARFALQGGGATAMPNDAGTPNTNDDTDFTLNSGLDVLPLTIGLYAGRSDWSVVGAQCAFAQGEVSGDAPAFSDIYNGVGLSSDTDSDLVVIGQGTYFGDPITLTGDIAEIVVYDRGLNGVEWQAMKNHLINKWSTF